MKSKGVIWSEQAIDSLKDHFEFIKADSPKAARAVKSEIIRASKSLSIKSERFQLDEYYPNNSGNIRRFFKWSYRIVYEVIDDEVHILNVLHTSQEPDDKD